jgi:rifampicin phosphotransferase
MTPATAEVPAREDWDNLNFTEPQSYYWTTDNVGEAAPGVQTPLSGSFWGGIGDSMPRRITHSMGVFSRSEVEPPTQAELYATLFYGRLAMRIEYLAVVGDRFPGITGQDAVKGMFAKVPEGISFHPTKRRYPVIAVKLPVAFMLADRRVGALAAETDTWWRQRIPQLETLSREQAAAWLAEGFERYDRCIVTHSLGLLASVQPMYDALSKLVESAGVGDVGVLSGTGGAEMAIITDIWRAAQGEIGIDGVIANHGFHGPMEGEVSSRVWREDPAPLERLISEYASRDASEDPVRRERESKVRADEMRRELLAALPRSKRPAARLLLRLAARRIPKRGVGKRSYLQAIDVARGSARALGKHLAADGVIADPEDVFYLTKEELRGELPADAADLVARRRERRAHYQEVSLPHSWRGIPDVTAPSEADASAVDLVEGMGVSSGVVEGAVRVVTDPTFAEVEQDEVLVTPTTDPSWASIMFMSSALVVDIGGPLSHAAVVARELGVPCVVNTRNGSQVLRTGDRVRVDGSAGTVEILERAG